VSTDPRLLKDIKEAEGCPVDKPSGLPVAYKDKLGNWTAGYGHLLIQTFDWTGHTWGWDTVDSWLLTDIQTRARQAMQTAEWQYLDTPCRCNAVVECIFNLGEKHWVDEFPATRASIRQQNWQESHDNLLASPLWIKQVGIARVTRLASYLLWGAYPA
jgi:GH24 family phage-related lysozyme (muramidase)